MVICQAISLLIHRHVGSIIVCFIWKYVGDVWIKVYNYAIENGNYHIMLWVPDIVEKFGAPSSTYGFNIILGY